MVATLIQLRRLFHLPLTWNPRTHIARSSTWMSRNRSTLQSRWIYVAVLPGEQRNTSRVRRYNVDLSTSRHPRYVNLKGIREITLRGRWLNYVALSTRHLHRDPRTLIGRLATRQSKWISTLHIYVEFTEIIYVLSTLRLRGCAGRVWLYNLSVTKCLNLTRLV